MPKFERSGQFLSKGKPGKIFKMANRKSTRLNSSPLGMSYVGLWLKKKEMMGYPGESYAHGIGVEGKLD